MMSVDIPKEARQKYIERRRTDLENCNKALQQGDFDVLARVAHQVKGNAVTFGYAELGTLAVQLEEAALAKNTTNATQVLAQFARFLSQL